MEATQMTPAMIGTAVLFAIALRIMWQMISKDTSAFGDGDYRAAQAAQHEEANVPTVTKKESR